MNNEVKDNKLFEECAALVARFKTGDELAYDELYEKTQRMVYYTCLGILKNDDDAFDAMQDAFLTVYKKLNDLEDDRTFISWLKRIATTRSLDLYKKRKGDVPYDDAIAADESLQVDDNLETLPDYYIMEKAKREALDKIIKDVLTDVQYQTIHMHYYSEFSVETIAEMMECPVGTVKTRLKAARCKIKEGVKKYEEENKDAFAAAPAIPFLTKFFVESSKHIKVPVLNPIKLRKAFKRTLKKGFFASTTAKVAAGVLAVSIPTTAVAVAKLTTKNPVAIVAEETEEIEAIEETTEETIIETTYESVEVPVETTEDLPYLVVVINERSFPDDVFRNYVSTNFDQNHDGSLYSDEVEQITEVDLYNSGASNLIGIERFIYLRELNCSNCNITELDLSSNTQLVEVSAYSNPLESIDVSTCRDLQRLYLDWCNLTSIDVTNNTRLSALSVSNNNLTALDVTNCPDLRTLTCSFNHIEELDLSNNVTLDYLDTISNEFTTLDISNCPYVVNTYLYGAYLTPNEIHGEVDLSMFGIFTVDLTLDGDVLVIYE